MRASSKLVLVSQSLSESVEKTLTHFEADLFPGNKIPLDIQVPESVKGKQTFTLQNSSFGESLSIIAAHFDCSLLLKNNTIAIRPLGDFETGFYLCEHSEPFRIGVINGDFGVDPAIFKKKIKLGGEVDNFLMLKSKPIDYLDLLVLRNLWERGWFGNIAIHKKKAYPHSVE